MGRTFTKTYQTKSNIIKSKNHIKKQLNKSIENISFKTVKLSKILSIVVFI